LRKDPAANLALILGIQAGLDSTLDQIVRTIDDLIPGKVPEPSQANDHHYGALKFYRLYGLDQSIREELRIQLLIFYSDSSKIIKEVLQLTTKKRPRYSHVFSSALEKSIDSAIKWIMRSDLNLIRDAWKVGIQTIDMEWDELLNLSRPRPIGGGGQRRSQPAIQLTQSTIPILKLSKLFFQKLSRELKKRYLPLFTEMSSKQLEVLDKSAETIHDAISDLLCPLDEAHESPRADTTRRLIQAIEQISSRFQGYVLLVVLYVIPLFPDLHDVSSRIYFSNWFITWNILLFSATDNAIKAARHFERDHP
jgi:hypothetical protein